MRKLLHLAKYFSNLNSSATRITKGVAAFSLSQLINFFVRIGLPPLYLYAWGIKIYGEWLVIYSVAAYLSLSCLGGQTYIVNRLSQLFSQKKEREYQSVFNSGLLLFILLTSTAFLLFIAAINLLPITALLHTSHITPTAVKYILLILAFEILLSLPQGLLTGVYQSLGKLHFGVMLINLMTFLQLLFCGVALYLRAIPIVIAILHMLPLIIIMLLAIWHAPSQFSFQLFSLKTVKLQQLKDFVKPSLNFLAIELSTAFSIQGVVIILGATLGSVQVVMFSTMRTIINMMKQILGVISNSAWREMTHYDAIKNEEKLRLLFRSILRTSLVAATLIATLLYFFSGSLYTLWLHHRVPFQQPIMDLFLLYGIEAVFWTACANLLMSTNQHHTLSRIYLLSAIISLIAVYLGGHYFGLHGAVLALLITDFALPVWLTPLLLYQYDPHFNLAFFARELIPIVIGIFLIPLLPVATAIFIPLLIYWWYRGLPIEALKAHYAKPIDKT